MAKRASLKDVPRRSLTPESEILSHPVDRFIDHPPGERLLFLPIDEIDPNPHQPRRHFDEASLHALAESIGQRGLLQPVLVRREGDRFMLIAGERRLRACRLAGLSKVRALITNDDPLELAMIENLQREDLSPFEEAAGYQALIDQHGYTHEQVAQIVGKSRPYISRMLQLTTVPPEIKAECLTSNIPKEQCLEVAQQDDVNKMKELLHQITTLGLTVQETRKRSSGSGRSSVRRSRHHPLTEYVQKLEQQLSKIHVGGLTPDGRHALSESLLSLRVKVDKMLGEIKKIGTQESIAGEKE
jgi:ParB family chromosome partitioning protein